MEADDAFGDLLCSGFDGCRSDVSPARSSQSFLVSLPRLFNDSRCGQHRLFLRIPYSHFFGHRGFFQSPFFGFFLSLILVSVFFRGIEQFSRQWFFYFIFLFLVSASHGLLDAFINGGLGVALLSPFDMTRYFFPWRPIVVSPVGVASFFSRWGLAVIKSELLWVWLPSFVMVIVSAVICLSSVRH